MIRIADRHRIRRRIKRIMEPRNAISGFDRLKIEDRARLKKLHDGVRLVGIVSEAHADEIAVRLHGELPWLTPASESVWWSLRRSVRDGLPGVRLEPLLLDGPPGIGKSAWARHLANLLGTSIIEIDATNESASFGIVGAQRDWGNSAPGRVLSDMLRHKVGNPIAVIDEIEKAGRPISMKGSVFDLPSALLPLLEPSTARRWTCPYHELPFDMGWIGWVLTSNDANLLPEPLSRIP
ncbi:AAA family ATPase [Paracoccus sp. PS-1]|uniref:AAA family ATPase n=1 Tax=unclassified Paracoccus (in: a-proteobacteria) TaxID=2688777 RepID=UPI0006855BB0|nr:MULTISPECIES: AAA family ATPase [unclassified Paracoccus (in: a-proteobacteria)]MDQ7263704.1 AAA family ATPase [Paracoccus sp. PS1]UFM63341.1 AAA family ATPase [Paracoccus sp. MA]